MPYKTRFRDLSLEQAEAGMNAGQLDANSARSYGAAFYRKCIAGNPNMGPAVAKAMLASWDVVIEPYLLESHPENLRGFKRERRFMAHYAEGVERAARGGWRYRHAGIREHHRSPAASITLICNKG